MGDGRRRWSLSASTATFQTNFTTEMNNKNKESYDGIGFLRRHFLVCVGKIKLESWSWQRGPPRPSKV